MVETQIYSLENQVGLPVSFDDAHYKMILMNGSIITIMNGPIKVIDVYGEHLSLRSIKVWNFLNIRLLTRKMIRYWLPVNFNVGQSRLFPIFQINIETMLRWVNLLLCVGTFSL